jgi:ribosome-associated toxin RatA of RatAB toxin-antitoxin module
MVGASRVVDGRLEQCAVTLAVFAFCLLFAARVSGADFDLTSDELAALERGEIVLRAPPTNASERKRLAESERDVVRAAVRIAARPDVVFRVMIDCAAALEYVPHLQRCEVLETAPDKSWQLIQQRLDYGWYTPALDYVFRAEYELNRAVSIRQVRGDFIANEGRWELEPASDGRTTLLRYRVRAVPPNFVPPWLQRRSMARELPNLLRGLRARAERSADLQSAAPRGKMPPLIVK